MIDENKLIEKLFNLRWDFIRDDLQLQWNRAIDKVVHVIQEQPTIQPQGIDKDRLIEKLSGLNQWTQFAEHWFKVEDVYALIKSESTVKSVPLYKIFNIIAGHSNYHGDDILTALTCVAEGKEVKNVEPLQQPQTGWIPVSSGKLPTKEDYSEDGFVLVQTDGDIIYKGFYEAESGFWVDEVGFKFTYMPIAWQPLPQPYKERE